MKKKNFATDFSVGFVLFVATVVVIASLFVVGDGKRFFTSQAQYQVALPSAGNLKAGSKVSLGGVIAGSIQRVDFSEDLGSSEVIVTLSIDRGYRERIREDSIAYLESQGLLGDAILYIKLGTADSPVQPIGSTIRFKERAMLDTLAGEEIRQGTTDLIRNISQVLDDMTKGQGTLGQLLKNPDLYNNINSFTQSLASVTQKVDQISQSLDVLTSQLKDRKGTLGQLFFSEETAKDFSSALTDASRTLGNLREMTDTMKAGRGSIGKLLAQDDLHDTARKTLDEMARAASRIDDLVTKAESSGSIIGRALLDRDTGNAFADMVGRLERSAASLEKVLAMVERGEGSLGMLVHDPSVVASLRDVFRGVSEAGLVQNLVRNVEREGREAYLRDMSLTQKEAQEVLRLRALRNLDGGTEGAQPGGAESKPVPAVAPEAPDTKTSTSKG